MLSLGIRKSPSKTAWRSCSPTRGPRGEKWPQVCLATMPGCSRPVPCQRSAWLLLKCPAARGAIHVNGAPELLVRSCSQKVKQILSG